MTQSFVKGRASFLIHLVGTTLFIASLFYLGSGIGRHWTHVIGTRIIHPGWFIASVGIYAISHLSTGFAWPFALRMLGERITLADGLRIGLVAQVGKYLPGNVAHYFGRAALAKTAGIPLRASGLSTVSELAFAIIAALVVAPGVLVGEHAPLKEFSQVSAIAATLFIGVAVIATAALAIRDRQRWPYFALSCICITLSLILSGLSAYALLASMGVSNVPWTLVTGAFGLAWIAGFLTPGAPGGIGVRETALVLLLGPYVGPATALACAILHRLVTAGVDATAAVVGYAWFAFKPRAKM